MTKYTLEAIAFRYEELSEEAKTESLSGVACQSGSMHCAATSSEKHSPNLRRFFQSKFVIGRLTTTHSGIVL